MEIKEDKIDGFNVVALGGRIDSTAAVEFEEKLIQMIDNGSQVMIVDFLDVKFISSAGLRVLLLAAKKVKPTNGKLLLCNMSPEVHEVFDISGFSSIFSIYPNINEALATLKAK